MIVAKMLGCGRVRITAFISGIGRSALSRQPSAPSNLMSRVQMYANDARTGIGRRVKRRSLKETMMAPAGDTG